MDQFIVQSESEKKDRFAPLDKEENWGEVVSLCPCLKYDGATFYIHHYKRRGKESIVQKNIN